CEVNHTGRVLKRHECKRQAFAAYLAQLPAGTHVAMEACGGAHFCGRRCFQYGLVPRVMAAQFVKSFRKSETDENNCDNAEASANAARQCNRRFVPDKGGDPEAGPGWHHVREGHKQAKTAIGNRIRGLLAEFGVIVAQGDAALKRGLAELDEQAVPIELLTL